MRLIAQFTYVLFIIQRSLIILFENIEVEDVQNIYPLDDEAKTEQKLVQLIDGFPIQDPLCPEVIFEYRKSKTYDDCVRN